MFPRYSFFLAVEHKENLDLTFMACMSLFLIDQSVGKLDRKLPEKDGIISVG